VEQAETIPMHYLLVTNPFQVEVEVLFLGYLAIHWQEILAFVAKMFRVTIACLVSKLAPRLVVNKGVRVAYIEIQLKVLDLLQDQGLQWLIKYLGEQVMVANKRKTKKFLLWTRYANLQWHPQNQNFTGKTLFLHEISDIADKLIRISRRMESKM
jgi:hypothetical protein